MVLGTLPSAGVTQAPAFLQSPIMPSTREPFARPVDCPVVQTFVIVSGIRVSLGSESVITAKMCSNVEHCIATHGAIERIQGCLLHLMG
jgi:hypothetical protein